MTFRQLLGLAAAAVLVIACSGVKDIPRPSFLAPQPACAAAADPTRLCIVVMGDSIGDGVPVQGDDRWWVKLEAALAKALPDRHVVVDDWAISGSRIELLESMAPGQPELDTYDLAIVIEGVNDQDTTPLDQWKPRYEAAIAAIEAKGPKVIVGTPPPALENERFTERFTATAQALREVAIDGRTLFDIDTRWRADGVALASAYYVDLIHQSVAGQAAMAELALGVVLKAIDAP